MGIFDKLLGKGGKNKEKISEEEDKPNIRKLKKDRDIDGLNKALEHSNKKVRGAAAQALARLAGSGVASESSIKLLEKALKDTDSFTRYCAALALGWSAEAGVASESSIEPLENALNDSDGAVCEEAAKALSKLEEAGITKIEIVDLRSDKEREIERQAKSSLDDEDEQIARKLLSLIQKAAFEYAMDKEAYEKKIPEINKIGKYLCSNGGSNRMKRIAYRVQALGGSARYLEVYWGHEGICGWMA